MEFNLSEFEGASKEQILEILKKHEARGKVEFLSSFIKFYSRVLDFVKANPSIIKGREISDIQATVDTLTALSELLSDDNLKNSPDVQEAYYAIYQALLSTLVDFGQQDISPSSVSENEKLRQAIMSWALPTQHVSPNSKLSNEIPHGTIINAGQIDLVTADKGKTNEVSSIVSVTFDPENDIMMTGKPYGPYDRDVTDALVSLWLYGDPSHVVTPAQVYKTMHHTTNNPSPQQLGAITRSIEKQRRIHVTVDATKEMQRRGFTVDGQAIESAQLDDFLIVAKAIQITTRGKDGKTCKVKAYQLQAEPILYTYANMTRQVISYNPVLLDVPADNTESRTAIKGYLLRRIHVMKHDKKINRNRQSNVILLDTLFKETALENVAPVQKRRHLEYIITALDYWISQKLISGYTLQKKGRATRGIEIAL